MTPAIALVILVVFLAVMVWVGISKAAEDGFFTSLCTLLVVFSAFHFVNLEWAFLYGFLADQLGMQGAHALSTAYWVGFAVILAPGVFIAKLLSRPKVPFPYPVEQYGSMAAGMVVGLLLFATLVQFFARFDFFTPFLDGLRYFRPLFHILGSKHV